MAENKVETVTLVSPNGSSVTVAASKQAERIAAGYRLPAASTEPEKRAAPKVKPAASA